MRIYRKRKSARLRQKTWLIGFLELPESSGTYMLKYVLVPGCIETCRFLANIHPNRFQPSDLANTLKSPDQRRPFNELTVVPDVPTAFGIVLFEHS